MYSVQSAIKLWDLDSLTPGVWGLAWQGCHVILGVIAMDRQESRTD